MAQIYNSHARIASSVPASCLRWRNQDGSSTQGVSLVGRPLTDWKGRSHLRSDSSDGMRGSLPLSGSMGRCRDCEHSSNGGLGGPLPRVTDLSSGMTALHPSPLKASGPSSRPTFTQRIQALAAAHCEKCHGQGMVYMEPPYRCWIFCSCIENPGRLWPIVDYSVLYPSRVSAWRKV